MKTFLPFRPACTGQKINILCRLALLLLLSVQTLFAQTTWTGTTNSNWAEAGNWSAGVPDAADDVTIPNTATQPVIMGGTAALALSVMVDAGAMLTINATGSLAIRNPATQALGNAGSLINDGTITIGATDAGGTYGLVNGGTFINGLTGLITIDSIYNIAVWNHMGTFTNNGRIDIGAVKGIGGPGVYNEAIFQNNGGTLNIDRTRGAAIYNLANSSFFNTGAIAIGSVAGTSFSPGIYNFSLFENNAGGEISIDGTGAGIDNRPDATFTNRAKIAMGGIRALRSLGLYNEGAFTITNTGTLDIDWCSQTAIHGYTGSTFDNSGKIAIGTRRQIGTSFGNGITNYASFINQVGAEISIDSAGNSAIAHFFNVFTNSGKITIGITAHYSSNPPLFNEATFNNTSTGLIKIDRISDGRTGLQNHSSVSIFTNSGILTIGALENAGGIGLFNEGSFSNTGGEISIDRVDVVSNMFGGSAIFNRAGNNTFTNTGKITIGSMVSGGRHGIYNSDGNFNNDGGEITIDNLTNDNSNHGLRNDSGTFTNTGKISIGGTAGATNWGLWNRSTFNNNAGGEIYIDRSVITALQNENKSFTNSGRIIIGSKAPIGDWGIYSRTDFDNAGGEIYINQANISALRNQLDTFINSGKIFLGNIAGAGDWGLWNEAIFQNKTLGEITINHSPNTGLHNSLGTFNNSGKITIGPNVSPISLANYLNFNNLDCGWIDISSGAVNNQSAVSNNGLMIINTNLAHTNAGTFTNDGILKYPQGNPVPGVTNNEIIVESISGTCPLNDALQLGGGNSFIPAGTWYFDEGLTEEAGTYNLVANTFSATKMTNGTHTLYFSIVDTENNCPKTVSIEVTISGLSDCSISGPGGAICPNSTGNIYNAPAGMGTYLWSISGDGAINGSNTGASVSINAGASGSYTVSVQLTKDGCASFCSKTEPIAIGPAYAMVAPAQYCENEPGAMIGMDGSEVGAMYQLKDGGGNNVGAAVAGTGAAFSFGPYPNGNYSVAITNSSCDAVLASTVNATATNCEIGVPNFCSCNAPSGYAPVTIKATAPEGQIWTVKEVIGLYGADPYPLVTVGTPLNYIGGNMYTLDVFRSNTSGYFIKLTNGFTDLDIQVGNP